MAIDRSWIEGNDQARDRLRGLVERLTEAELSLPLGDGWTVAAVLAHLAFWDYRALALIKRWTEGGEVDHSPVDQDVVNEAAQPLAQAVPPVTAARMAVAAATAVDERVAQLDDSLLGRIEAAGWPLNPRRSEHRNEHVTQIGRALGWAQGADPGG